MTWIFWTVALCAVAIIAFAFGLVVGGALAVGDVQRREHEDGHE